MSYIFAQTIVDFLSALAIFLSPTPQEHPKLGIILRLCVRSKAAKKFSCDFYKLVEFNWDQQKEQTFSTTLASNNELSLDSLSQHFTLPYFTGKVLNDFCQRTPQQTCLVRETMSDEINVFHTIDKLMAGTILQECYQIFNSFHGEIRYSFMYPHYLATIQSKDMPEINKKSAHVFLNAIIDCLNYIQVSCNWSKINTEILKALKRKIFFHLPVCIGMHLRDHPNSKIFYQNFV